MVLISCQEGGRSGGSELSLPEFLVNMHEAKMPRHIFKPGSGGVKGSFIFSPLRESRKAEDLASVGFI